MPSTHLGPTALLPVVVHTEHGSFRGKTVESVVAREYGRQAFVQYTSSFSDGVGMVLKLHRDRVCEPLAVISSLDEWNPETGS